MKIVHSILRVLFSFIKVFSRFIHNRVSLNNYNIQLFVFGFKLKTYYYMIYEGWDEQV